MTNRAQNLGYNCCFQMTGYGRRCASTADKRGYQQPMSNELNKTCYSQWAWYYQIMFRLQVQENYFTLSHSQRFPHQRKHNQDGNLDPFEAKSDFKHLVQSIDASVLSHNASLLIDVLFGRATQVRVSQIQNDRQAELSRVKARNKDRFEN